MKTTGQGTVSYTHLDVYKRQSEKYDLQVLRFFMLSAHYRSPLNFSADLMEASKKDVYKRQARMY